MKKALLFGSLGLVFFSSTAFIVLNSTGIAGRTGSPGEVTCSGCHGGGSGSTVVAINATPAFTANQYVPGQTYTISIDITNNAFSQFGFGCEILNASNANAGTMANGGSGVAFANSGARKNAIHTAAKSGTGGTSFTFEWTAPASGNATIYAAGNAVNGNGNTSGDTPGNTSLALTALGTGIEKQSDNKISLNLFPNPSSDEYSLQYNLTEEGNVKVSLFSLSGQELSVLHEERQQTGLHDLSGKLSPNLASGIYFIKLSVNNTVSAQKMLIKK